MQKTENTDRQLYMDVYGDEAGMQDGDHPVLSKSIGFTVLDDGRRHEFVIEGLEEWRASVRNY